VPHDNLDGLGGRDSLVAVGPVEVVVEVVVEVEEAMTLVARHPHILITRLALERRIMFHQTHKFLDLGFGRALPVVGLLGMVLGGALPRERSSSSNSNSNNRHSLPLGQEHKLSQVDGFGMSMRLIAEAQREVGILMEVRATGVVGRERILVRDSAVRSGVRKTGIRSRISSIQPNWGFLPFRNYSL
jgi:hypothetical protein